MSPTGDGILIVDDEIPLVKVMTLYLTRRGFRVTGAHTTEAAWAEVEADPGKYRVAVLDGSMAGMSMAELARRILERNLSMHVLVASGYPVDISALEAGAPGRVSFLQKPFTPEMLATAVRRLLGAQEENV